MGAGKPRKFNNPDELEKMISDYFEECEKNNEPPLITGLAEYLDTWKDVLYDYANGVYDTENCKYSNPVKKALNKVAKVREIGTQTGKINAAAGIFLLKNHGFTDKHEVDMNVSGSISLVDLAGIGDKDEDNG